MKRKTYTADQFQELVLDLKKFGLAFALYYRKQSHSLILFTAVKKYIFPCDESIKECSVYNSNELIFKFK